MPESVQVAVIPPRWQCGVLHLPVLAGLHGEHSASVQRPQHAAVPVLHEPACVGGLPWSRHPRLHLLLRFHVRPQGPTHCTASTCSDTISSHSSPPTYPLRPLSASHVHKHFPITMQPFELSEKKVSKIIPCASSILLDWGMILRGILWVFSGV